MLLNTYVDCTNTCIQVIHICQTYVNSEVNEIKVIFDLYGIESIYMQLRCFEPGLVGNKIRLCKLMPEPDWPNASGGSSYNVFCRNRLRARFYSVIPGSQQDRLLDGEVQHGDAQAQARWLIL